MKGDFRRQFAEELGKLNSAQKRAVEAISGPVMVIAGPGTGKTQILTLRIANILDKTDTPPDGILALTFTEAAAANMRKRLGNMIGSRGYYVTINTFHGFCDSIIKNYPEYFPRIVGGTNVDEVRRIEIVEEIIEGGDFKEIKPYGNKFFYVRELLGKISSLKKDGVGAEEFAELIKEEQKHFEDIEGLRDKEGKVKSKYLSAERKIRRSGELATVYAKYQQELEKRHWYDFEDMILLSIQALEHHRDLLLELQERYQYILVDEHQDTNQAQNKVVELLGNFYENPNIFVVGDTKQAIYKFQGASLENFLYFKSRYPAAEVIELQDNYRSTQRILDAATTLIKNNRAILGVELRAQARKEDLAVRVVTAENPEAELDWIAADIKKKIESGTRPEEIAVLYRENKEAAGAQAALGRVGLPAAVESDINILEDQNLKKLTWLLQAIESFGDEEKLIRALHIDWLGLSPLSIFQLVETSRRIRRPLITILGNKEILNQNGIAEAEKIEKLFAVFSELKRKSQNQELASFLDAAIKESGMLNFLLRQEDYLENVDKLRGFFQEVRKISQQETDSTLTDFIRYIERLKEHNILIKLKSPKRKAVRLMTAHRAKGLEFETVYITGAVDKKWGNKRRAELFIMPAMSQKLNEDAEKNEEERRLFYMALTRAKKEAVITYPETNTDGRETVPSQFITEIDSTHRQEEQAKQENPEVNDETTYPKEELKEREREYLREIFQERGLSVTALNNYLECPWKWFYNNLIRIPQVKPAAASYGSAIHRTLREFFEARNRGQVPERDWLKAEFGIQIEKEGLNQNDQKRFRERGEAALASYFDEYQNFWNGRTENEMKIEISLPEGMKLNGTLDKLELSGEGEGATVVDYKTGNPKSRNEIEGKTKNSLGNYKRQLVFYKILLDRYPGKYKMEKGVLDFVEPNQRGKFKREEFLITEAETKELEEVIKKTWEDISSFGFWGKRCGEKKCEWCDLAEMLKK